MITVSDIDNGIYEKLRKETVRLGYLPDIALYQPPNPANEAAYEAARQAIINSGKEIIEVFNVGNSDDRDGITKNKIIVDRSAPEKGNISFHNVEKLVPVGDPEDPATKYKKVKLPAFSYFITYQITYICVKSKYDYIIQDILRKALLNFTYLKGYDDNGTELSEGFNIMYMTTIDQSDAKFVERIYRFRVGEVILDNYEEEDEYILQSNISQITDIDVENVPKQGEFTDEDFEQ